MRRIAAGVAPPCLARQLSTGVGAAVEKGTYCFQERD